MASPGPLIRDYVLSCVTKVFPTDPMQPPNPIVIREIVSIFQPDQGPSSDVLGVAPLPPTDLGWRDASAARVRAQAASGNCSVH